MRTTRFFIVGTFIALLAYSAAGKAEDIDLYSGLSGAAGIPNVLMVMDTGANFSASANPPCTAYASGGAPSLGSTGGGVEQCALVDAIESLPLGTVNIGIMVNNGNNFTDGSSVSPVCIGSNGGCLVWPLHLMDAAGKSALITFIKSWKLSGANSATEFVIKSGGDRTGSNIQEAWAYYTGHTGLSGQPYSTNILDGGCQKNFIINIGNSFSNSGGPADTALSDPNNATYGLQSAQVNATTAQKTKLTDTIKFPVTTCGVNQLAAGSAASDWSNNWADEWARYMYGKDQSSTLEGTQNITTYTIGVINNGTNTCKPDYPALLTNMATYGGGKYFQTGDTSEVTQALLKILNEVQAVNSVFASSSLPVSVNTQGTFLNQVFIGMFRPDALGNPRWLGNLKQYQFLLNTSTGTVSLGDSLGVGALSAAGTKTGFISPNAVSFWTCGGNPSVRTCSPADPTGGYWVNQPQSAGGAYDLPDGELVEKGGAAQILRLANLQDDYTAAAGTSTNPRKLYTYCPSGASCVAALSNSVNAFEPNNVDISATSFGSTSSANISNITLSNPATGTATVTTSGAHGFSVNTSVTISGASPTTYNGVYTIASVPTTTTFTITGVTVTPPTPATGTYQVQAASASGIAISSMSRTTAGTNTETVTVNTSTNHGFTDGASITITGATPSRYNGTYTITVPNGGPGLAKFTYSISILPPTPATGTYTVGLSSASAKSISALSCSVSGSGANKKATVSATTSSAHGFNTNDYVTMAGNTPSGYNGSFNLASASGSSFTYVIATGSSVTCAGASAGTATVFGTATAAAATQTLSSLTRTGTTDTSTATATIPTANRFATGDIVNIAQTVVGANGTNDGAYVVNSASITCATTACTSFTYPITVTPSTTITTTGALATSSAGATPIDIVTLTRSGTTATATLGSNYTGTTNATILVKSGFSIPANEAAYTGNFTISCTNCSTFTYTVPVSPAASTTGTASAIIPPSKTNLVNWVRGQDNYGDEVASPGAPITVRPSIHGDVLHSRPVVINYGGTTGVVAFYGANDGVFHAVNANQTNPTGSSLPVPGSELWGFIPTEFYGKLDRQRTNSPQLLLPSTPSGIVPAPQKKDYFADGATGVYQEVDATGATTTADIFITMRRGGNIIYALDVCNLSGGVCVGPTAPFVMWKKSNSDTGFSELGETWSRPKTAKLTGYANTVLIFGAGYDTAEDSEPPGTDTKGRGIFIVDAATGALVWSATHSSSGSTTCSGGTTQATCLVSGMDYSIPSDISLIDKNGDGKIDRLYVGDTGGNIWRVDLEPPSGYTTDFWQITKLAALGCSTGVCATPATSSTTPRKFFYQPDVVPSSGFDIVLAGTGDREHPLLSSVSLQNVTNRFYALSDFNTGNDGSLPTTPSEPITEASLFDATSATYNGTLSDGTTPASGFYITLAAGEKVVNAPATIAGQTFFGTNQPTAPSVNSCDTNLGIARGYKISPFSANGSFSAFEGGGLPPTPVYGLVEIARVDSSGNAVLDNEGKQIIDQVPFCIGCGGTGSTDSSDHGGDIGGCASDPSAAGCSGGTPLPPECGAISSLEACKAIIDASTDRWRTYWYLEKDQ